MSNATNATSPADLAAARMARPTSQLNLDECLARCSAIGSFAELIESITKRGYVPTLRTTGGGGDFDEAVLIVRGRLQALGHAVYPASLAR